MPTDAIGPKLTVVIVVDQMCSDEVDRLQGQWTAGLKTLIDAGTVYTQAVHTHGYTETASGHATIATGVLPREHGVLDKNV